MTEILPLILHTADLHLRELRDYRWNALEKVLDLGKEKNIDILVISGDLFDSKAKGELLLDPLIELFQNYRFQILFILGNHDEKICSTTGTFFGSNVRFLDDLNSPFVYNNNVCLWGFSYSDSVPHFEIPKKLHEIAPFLDKYEHNLLIYHGNFVDKTIKNQNYTEDPDRWEMYMPLKAEYFTDLNFEYILCGHNHKQFTVRKPLNQLYF